MGILLRLRLLRIVFGSRVFGGLRLRSRDAGEAVASAAHPIELVVERGWLERRLLKGQLIAPGQVVPMGNVGVSGSLALFRAIYRTGQLDSLFVLAPQVLGSSPDGGFSDGLVAVLLQGLNVGRKAAEHVNDFGIFFGLGSEVLDNVGLKK